MGIFVFTGPFSEFNALSSPNMGANCLSEASVGVTSGACGIDFTIAFEDYVLILIPASCLILLAPIRLRTIWSRSIKVVTPTILQLIKTVRAEPIARKVLLIYPALCTRIRWLQFCNPGCYMCASYYCTPRRDTSCGSGFPRLCNCIHSIFTGTQPLDTAKQAATVVPYCRSDCSGSAPPNNMV